MRLLLAFLFFFFRVLLFEPLISLSAILLYDKISLYNSVWAAYDVRNFWVCKSFKWIFLAISIYIYMCVVGGDKKRRGPFITVLVTRLRLFFFSFLPKLTSILKDVTDVFYSVGGVLSAIDPRRVYRLAFTLYINREERSTLSTSNRLSIARVCPWYPHRYVLTISIDIVPDFLFQQSKNSGRAVRKPDNVEETGVEESVCSVDGPSSVHYQPPPPSQLAQSSQQQQSNPSDSTDILASEIAPLPMVSANTKTVSKFWSNRSVTQFDPPTDDVTFDWLTP
jgi:hypothetical protein